MKLEKYISDLLYRYDLVIVPNFGAIIGRRKNARLDRSSNTLSPPYKELSFNVNLKEDDGLLVRYIADLQQLSNIEASLRIQETITAWHKILGQTGTLKLDQIGIFKQLDEERIIYMPLTTKNYLAEAYGLSAVVHNPLVIKQTLAPSTLKTLDKVTDKKPVFEQSRSLKSARKPKKAFINEQLIKYAAIFIVGIGLFGGAAKIYQKETHQPVEVFQKATFVLQQDFPAITINKPQVKTIIASPILKEKESVFIISGAFRSKTNAQKKVSLLKKANYNAKIIGKNKSDLHLVAYQGYLNIIDAERALTNIKKIQPSAWIFTTK